jgi:hypothetical protein
LRTAGRTSGLMRPVHHRRCLAARALKDVRCVCLGRASGGLVQSHLARTKGGRPATMPKREWKRAVITGFDARISEYVGKL